MIKSKDMCIWNVAQMYHINCQNELLFILCNICPYTEKKAPIGYTLWRENEKWHAKYIWVRHVRIAACLCFAASLKERIITQALHSNASNYLSSFDMFTGNDTLARRAVSQLQASPNQQCAKGGSKWNHCTYNFPCCLEKVVQWKSHG